MCWMSEPVQIFETQDAGNEFVLSPRAFEALTGNKTRRCPGVCWKAARKIGARESEEEE